MISDADFLTWLDSDACRCLLVEATYYDFDAATEKTARLSNWPYQTKPGDSLDACFDDILAGVPTISAAMGQPLSVGNVVVDNSDGSLDGWLDHAWDRRAVAFRLGDPAWSYDDFRIVFTGVIDDIASPSRDKLALVIRDRMELLNGPVQTNLYASGPAAGLPKPLALGALQNITPVLIDTASAYTFQVHDGAVDAILEVREGGNPLTPTTDYTVDLANGTFTLTGTPTLPITCDCQGATLLGTWLYKPADLITYLVTVKGGLAAATYIDSTSFAAWNSAVGTSDQMGLYIPDRRNLADCINQLCTSVAGERYFNRVGKLALWRLDVPSGSPVMEFTADDIYLGEYALVRREPPIKKQRRGTQPNWTRQGPAVLAGALTDRYAWDYDWQTITDYGGAAVAYKGALEPELIPTLYVTYNTAENTRLSTMRSVPRHIYQYTLPARAQMLNLGDEIKITHGRFGAAGGVYGIVVGIEAQFGGDRTKVQVWR